MHPCVWTEVVSALEGITVGVVGLGACSHAHSLKEVCGILTVGVVDIGAFLLSCTFIEESVGYKR